MYLIQRLVSNVRPQHAVVKFSPELQVQQVIKVQINQLDPFDFAQANATPRDKRFYVFDDQSVVIVHSPFFNSSTLRIVRYNSNGTMVYNLKYSFSLYTSHWSYTWSVNSGYIAPQKVFSSNPLQFTILGIRMTFPEATNCECFNTFAIEYRDNLVPTTGACVLYIVES